MVRYTGPMGSGKTTRVKAKYTGYDLMQVEDCDDFERWLVRKRDKAATPRPPARFRDTATDVNHLVAKCHNASLDAGWWPDKHDIKQNPNIVPAKMCLIHSEVSEAMEGHRKNLMNDKLPHRKMVEVELADALIRIADLAGALGLDLGGAVVEKIVFNVDREDHKPEHRSGEHGKAY